MVPREEKCYDFNLDTSTLYDWIEDKARCAQYGMKLMTIESSEEDEWVNLELYKTGLFSGSESNVDGVWLGFSGESGRGAFAVFVFSLSPILRMHMYIYMCYRDRRPLRQVLE